MVKLVHTYPDEFERWSDGTPIVKRRQQEILKNFKDAMEFLGVTVLVAS